MLTFIWKHKNSRIVKVVLWGEHKREGVMIPDFKTHYKTVKTTFSCIKINTQIIEIKERPELKPHVYH